MTEGNEVCMMKNRPATSDVRLRKTLNALLTYIISTPIDTVQATEATSDDRGLPSHSLAGVRPMPRGPPRGTTPPLA